MAELKKWYKEFCGLLNSYLEPLLDKNIIIYGCNHSGDFIRWYYKNYFNKEIKAMADRWELSSVATIPHLWVLYYIYDENDIIINVTDKRLKEEFNDTGELWERLKYKEGQILNLWEEIYGREWSVKADEQKPQITYYDWIEYRCGLDLLKTIRRQYVKGEHSHGYFPTDFRIFAEAIQKVPIDSAKDAVLDIGSGKGSAVTAFLANGFTNVGAVEYTEDIYHILLENLRKMNIDYTENIAGNGVCCYLGDAALLNKELDYYNWFFLFNPFSWDITKQVIENICGSINRKARKVYIFYAEPIGHQLIMDTKMFKVKEQICSNLSGVSYYSYIYENIET